MAAFDPNGLLADAQAGRADWDAIYERVRATMYHAVWGVLRAHRCYVGVEDHDIVQEAFSEMVQKGLTDAPSLEARARVVAYRRAVDRLRAHQRNPECPWPEAPAALGAELGADDEMLLDEELRHREHVLAQALVCLDRLPKRLADAVRDNVMRGISLAEIARRHGVSHEAARKWRNKGLEQLVQCLEQTTRPCRGRSERLR